MSRDFWLQVFFMNLLPQAPENNIRVISNSFENSRRYLQVKVHHRCQRHRWQILPPIPLVLLICHRCQRPRWCTLNCEYLREFSKKIETALMVYSRAWGKLIHEKKPEAENLLALFL